jgi:hypothetical protein
MKKQLLLLLTFFTLINACTKSSNPVVANLGTGSLTAAATLSLLTSNSWVLSSTQGAQSNYGPYLLQFSANNYYGPDAGTLTFGQAAIGGPGVGANGSTDSFSFYVRDGATYLTVTDDVAAISLTDFSTYYKVTAISSSGFTMAPANQVSSTAPSFPSITLSYVKAAN